MRAVVPIIVAVAALAGCSEGLAPASDLGGAWVATRVESSVGLNIEQHGDTIVGSGTWQKAANPPSGYLAINGVYLRPQLTLTLYYDNGTTSHYTAEVPDPDHILGSEVFADGTTDSLTFVRQ